MKTLHFFVSKITIAVSYTHLDVYKRQVQGVTNKSHQVLRLHSREISLQHAVPHVHCRCSTCALDAMLFTTDCCYCLSSKQYSVSCGNS